MQKWLKKIRLEEIPGVSPSHNALLVSMKKLLKIYHEAGGEEFMEMIDETVGLTKFDALKIIISKKIDETRNHLKELKGTRTLTYFVKKKQTIRKMLKNIEEDFEDLKKEFKRISIGSFAERITRKKKDFKLENQQKEDIEIISNHIHELNQIIQTKYNDKTRKPMQKSKLFTKGEIFDNDEDENTNPKEIKIRIETKDDEDVVAGLNKYDLPQDPTKTYLPPIDIRSQMQIIKKNKMELKNVLQDFESKLGDLKEQAIGIGYALQNDSKILDDMKIKVENRANEVKTLNKVTGKAKDHVNEGTKLIMIICIVIIIIILLVAFYIIFIQMGILKFNV